MYFYVVDGYATANDFTNFNLSVTNLESQLVEILNWDGIIDGIAVSLEP